MNTTLSRTQRTLRCFILILSLVFIATPMQAASSNLDNLVAAAEAAAEAAVKAANQFTKILEAFAENGHVIFTSESNTIIGAANAAAGFAAEAANAAAKGDTAAALAAIANVRKATQEATTGTLNIISLLKLGGAIHSTIGMFDSPTYIMDEQVYITPSEVMREFYNSQILANKDLLAAINLYSSAETQQPQPTLNNLAQLALSLGLATADQLSSVGLTIGADGTVTANPGNYAFNLMLSMLGLSYDPATGLLSISDPSCLAELLNNNPNILNNLTPEMLAALETFLPGIYTSEMAGLLAGAGLTYNPATGKLDYIYLTLAPTYLMYVNQGLVDIQEANNLDKLALFSNTLGSIANDNRTATVSGNLQGGSPTDFGVFGFNAKLSNGMISGATMTSKGSATSYAATGGSGQLYGSTFNISGFTGTAQSQPITSAHLNGTAPNGLGAVGNAVNGTYEVNTNASGKVSAGTATGSVTGIQ